MCLYNHIFWDIIGACNADCKYCCNGGKSLSGKLHRNQAGILQPSEFEDSITFLMSRGVIDPGQTRIELYNWGEPLLHPEFATMINIVATKGFYFGLSTNASIQKIIPPSSISKLAEIRFSMPGFSQKSYDKMHGFDFDVICQNIEFYCDQVRSVSSNTSISIVFHSYKFNQCEYEAARNFCETLKINLSPQSAYFNGLTMAKDFYAGNLSLEDNARVTDELLIEKLEAVRSIRPNNYLCPQYSILALDEYCNVLLCCGTDRIISGHVIGKLKDVDFNKIKEMKQKSETCIQCSHLNIDYMWHNS